MRVWDLSSILLYIIRKINLTTMIFLVGTFIIFYLPYTQYARIVKISLAICGILQAKFTLGYQFLATLSLLHQLVCLMYLLNIIFYIKCPIACTDGKISCSLALKNNLNLRQVHIILCISHDRYKNGNCTLQLRSNLSRPLWCYYQQPF